MITPLPKDKIDYRALQGKAQEVHNRQKLGSILADYGLQLIPLTDDVNGADFLLKDPSGVIHSVQQKGRISIARKYLHNPSLYIAFPDPKAPATHWYIVRHVDLVSMLDATGATKTRTWIEEGHWSSKHLTAALRPKLEPHLFVATDHFTRKD